jgi:hypothetical protein
MPGTFDLDSIPWPKPGDDVFVADEDFHYDALIGWAGTAGGWGVIAEGYKRIADIAVEEIERSTIDLDFLVYPIAFNYRQCLELQLKQLWMDCKRLAGENPDVPLHHRIDVVWRECRPTLDDFEPQSKDDHDAVEAVIAGFAKIDPDSYAFRYPVDKKGRRALPRELQRLSPRNMRDVIAGVAVFLDGALTQVDEALHAQDSFGP